MYVVLTPQPTFALFLSAYFCLTYALSLTAILSFSHLLDRSLKRRKAFVVEKNEMFLAFAAWSACLEWPELCKVLATFGL